MIAPEQWRVFRNSEYEISDQGRFRKKTKNGYKYIEGCPDKGESRVRVYFKGKKYQISRLVWETFKGEIPSDCNVTHENGLYRDNSLYNLRLINKDQHRKIIKKHQQPVADLKNRVIYKSLRDAEKKLKVRRRWISLCCRGLRKGTSIDVAWWDRENRRAYRGEFRCTDC